MLRRIWARLAGRATNPAQVTIVATRRTELGGASLHTVRRLCHAKPVSTSPRSPETREELPCLG